MRFTLLVVIVFSLSLSVAFGKETHHPDDGMSKPKEGSFSCASKKQQALSDCRYSQFTSEFNVDGTIKKTYSPYSQRIELKMQLRCKDNYDLLKSTCVRALDFSSLNTFNDLSYDYNSFGFQRYMGLGNTQPQSFQKEISLATQCPAQYKQQLEFCAYKDSEAKLKAPTYGKIHQACPYKAVQIDKELKQNNCAIPERAGFDASKYGGEKEEVKAKAHHGETVSGEKCELKKVVIGEEDWKIWNGFDVFSLDPKKYLGHVHGKNEKDYFEKPKFAVCKPTEEVEEVVVKDEYKSCEWVDYQEWSGQLGCKTEKSKVCIGKVACAGDDGVVKYHNVACAGVDGECPSAAECASDESLQSTEKSFISDKYSTETKVKAE